MKRSTKIIAAVAIAALGITALAGTSIASKRGGYGYHHGYGGYGGYGDHMGRGHGGQMGPGHGGGGFAMLDRFDTDKDGKITKAEIKAFQDKALADYDADKDGKLTLEEFQGVWSEFMRNRMVRQFQRLDADGDAKVTMDEIRIPMDRMMTYMDHNNDGVISKDDMGRGWGWKGDDDNNRPGPGPMRRGN